MALTTFKNDMRITGNLSVGGTITGDAQASTAAGAGITTGTGTVHAVSVTRNGSLIETKILVDMTGLTCGGTAGDIIGVAAASSCHIGQITEAVNGTIFGGVLRCLEAPTGGDPDIDLFSAVESTGATDAAISTLDETQLCNSGDLTAGGVVPLTAYPAADEYLYLVCGTATAAAYTAGIVEITLYGR